MAVSLKEYKPVESELNILSNTSLDGKSNITKSSSSEQPARERKSAHRFKWSLPNSHYKKGQDFCPVSFFTGHEKIWTRVQEWTCVQDPMCPVESLL